MRADATRPYEWREKFPKVSGASRDLKGRVTADWLSFLDQKFGRKGEYNSVRLTLR
jgi:hypothetical protein